VRVKRCRNARDFASLFAARVGLSPRLSGGALAPTSATRYDGILISVSLNSPPVGVPAAGAPVQRALRVAGSEGMDRAYVGIGRARS
jgi:hypothetical protein